MRAIFLAGPVLAALCSAAMADTLPAPTGTPCRSQPMGRVLDFWVGDWTVVNADGSPSGTNLVERMLDGCAVIENWHGVDAGDDGKSLFTYDGRHHTWDQVWVTQDTTRPGGLKHKRLLDVRYGGVVRFQGTIAVRKGESIVDRTSLTPLTDGRVRQTIEWSKDGGKTFKMVFDSFYIRKGANYIRKGANSGAAPGGDPH